MRSRFTIAALMCCALVLSFGPSQAASAYHMNGAGTLTIGGGGMPACLPAANVPNCSNPDNSFSWGDLDVQGLGVLANSQVAGRYKCASEGGSGTTAFESRIKGNTSNYQLTFNFRCTLTTGAGPAVITGWFSNVTSTGLGAAYHSVSGHPTPGPVASGVPAFKGYFNTTGVHPYAITDANGERMSCVGGFAPATFGSSGGPTIASAAFTGACTAAE